MYTYMEVGNYYRAVVKPGTMEMEMEMRVCMQGQSMVQSRVQRPCSRASGL